MSQVGKLLLSVPIEIRWSDMDAMGHVNNTVFFKYFEHVRVEWLNQIKNQMLNKSGEGPILLHTECTFLKQLAYPDSIEAKILNGKVGTSSFMQNYELIRKSDGTTCATGRSKMVWIDYLTGQSTPLPDFMQKLLS